MARKKTSPLEDMVIVVSKLPWWVCLILAVLSYFLLHVVASRPVNTVAVPGQMGDVVTKGLVTMMATLGQYLLPFAFSLGALISGVKATRQKKLYENVASRQDIAALSEINWADFERLVCEYFFRNDFQVSRLGGNGPDDGIDIVLRQKNETYLVQCKQWKAYKVGVQPVREFYGVMASRGAAGGYFVTSGEYTEEAKAFAHGLNLELIDGRKLREMIVVASKATPAGATVAVPSTADTPACPKCGSEMKKRVARQGTNSGKEFWGCIAYPKCNGVRAL